MASGSKQSVGVDRQSADTVGVGEQRLLHMHGPEIYKLDAMVTASDKQNTIMARQTHWPGGHRALRHYLLGDEIEPHKTAVCIGHNNIMCVC